MKSLLINPFVTSIKIDCNYLLLINILSNQVKMKWDIGDNKNLFLKLESILGPYNVVFTTPEPSPKELTLTVLEMQQLH